MKNIAPLIVALTLCIFTDCNRNGNIENYTLDQNSKKQPKGSILFTKDKNSYFYNLGITDSFFVFMDNNSDTVMRVYQKENLGKHLLFSCRKFEKKGLWAPILTKEVYSWSTGDTIRSVDNDLYLRTFVFRSTGIECYTSNFPQSTYHSTDYNLTSTEIYASPLYRTKTYPFYFYNPDAGYYWVDPSPWISNELPDNAMLYTNNLCVNESQDAVVSAFRFVNYISFYNLQGTLKTTIQSGEKMKAPPIILNENELNVDKATKYFIDIYGTPLHVYCLYDGTPNFSDKSKVFVFNWKGKHINTIQLDRPVRKFAVDKNDKYIIAIATNDTEGQDIIQYNL